MAPSHPPSPRNSARRPLPLPLTLASEGHPSLAPQFSPGWAATQKQRSPRPLPPTPHLPTHARTSSTSSRSSTESMESDASDATRSSHASTSTNGYSSSNTTTTSVEVSTSDDTSQPGSPASCSTFLQLPNPHADIIYVPLHPSHSPSPRSTSFGLPNPHAAPAYAEPPRPPRPCLRIDTELAPRTRKQRPRPPPVDVGAILNSHAARKHAGRALPSPRHPSAALPVPGISLHPPPQALAPARTPPHARALAPPTVRVSLRTWIKGLRKKPVELVGAVPDAREIRMEKANWRTSVLHPERPIDLAAEVWGDDGDGRREHVCVAASSSVLRVVEADDVYRMSPPTLRR